MKHKVGDIVECLKYKGNYIVTEISKINKTIKVSPILSNKSWNALVFYQDAWRESNMWDKVNFKQQAINEMIIFLDLNQQ